MKKTSAIVALSVMLVACSTPTVEDFLADPELLQKTFEECANKAAAGKRVDDEECANATVAFRMQLGERVQNTMNSVSEALKF